MVVNGKYFNSVNRVAENQPLQKTAPQPAPGQGDFGQILRQKISGNEELKFSKHAEMRLQSRNIQLTEAQKDKVSQAVTKAGQKGVKDSLVLMDDIAFVVNVRSRTVITAVNSNELKENVFTNIDGAVFA